MPVRPLPVAGCQLPERFIALMDKLRIPEKAKIAVAVSGGGDSMALVLLAKDWVSKTGHEIIAITVDHGLREDSAREAKQVAAWLESLGIPHKILTNNACVRTYASMDFARKIRYHLLTDYAKENAIDYLLTAHNIEDQVETFLMRLERGSGVDGLAAIPAVTKMHGIKIIRPLLNVKREELRQYLREKNQPWLEDPTNQNKKYQRNRLRSILEQLHGEDGDILLNRLHQTTISMARARKALEIWTNKEIDEHLEKTPDGSCTINHQYFCGLPEEIGLRILSRIFDFYDKGLEKVRFASLLPLYEKIISGTLPGSTLSNCKITLKKGKIGFSAESSDKKDL